MKCVSNALNRTASVLLLLDSPIEVVELSPLSNMHIQGVTYISIYILFLPHATLNYNIASTLIQFLISPTNTSGICLLALIVVSCKLWGGLLSLLSSLSLSVHTHVRAFTPNINCIYSHNNVTLSTAQLSAALHDKGEWISSCERTFTTISVGNNLYV